MGYAMKLRIPEHGRRGAVRAAATFWRATVILIGLATRILLVAPVVPKRVTEVSQKKNIPKLPSKNLSYKMWSLLSCQPSTRAKSLHFDALKQYPAPFTL